jgi:hypothetical protein
VTCVGGVCDPGESCLALTTNGAECVCLQECGVNPACDGPCPAGQACAFGTAGQPCFCTPTAAPCGSLVGDPNCWGLCNPGEICVPDGGGACECALSP